MGKSYDISRLLDDMKANGGTVPDLPEARAAAEELSDSLTNEMCKWYAAFEKTYNVCPNISMSTNVYTGVGMMNYDTIVNIDTLKGRPYIHTFIGGNDTAGELKMQTMFVGVSLLGMREISLNAHAKKSSVSQPDSVTINYGGVHPTEFVPGLVQSTADGKGVSMKLTASNLARYIEWRKTYRVMWVDYDPDHLSYDDIIYAIRYPEVPKRMTEIADKYSISFLYDGKRMQLDEEYISDDMMRIIQATMHYNPIALSSMACSGSAPVDSLLSTAHFICNMGYIESWGYDNSFDWEDPIFNGMPLMDAETMEDAAAEHAASLQ